MSKCEKFGLMICGLHLVLNLLVVTSKRTRERYLSCKTFWVLFTELNTIKSKYVQLFDGYIIK